MSLKVVYDTSVVVAAALKAHGIASTLLSLALTRTVTLYVSPPILQEYQDVLARPKFRLPLDTVAPLLGAIRQTAVLVTPRNRIAISPDEPDNRFLECAQAAHADYLVTNNTRHFPPVAFEGMRIGTPAMFARMVAESLSPRGRVKFKP